MQADEFTVNLSVLHTTHPYTVLPSGKKEFITMNRTPVVVGATKQAIEARAKKTAFANAVRGTRRELVAHVRQDEKITELLGRSSESTQKSTAKALNFFAQNSDPQSKHYEELTKVLDRYKITGKLRGMIIKVIMDEVRRAYKAKHTASVATAA
jgi:hypothetical protein